MASEENLMESYVEGDERSFDALFRVLSPSVRRFFLLRFRDSGIADDLLQTTFLKLHRARRDYRVGAPLRPWVFSIAARVGLDELRRRARHPEEVDEKKVQRAFDRSGAFLPNPETLAERGAIAEKVQDALQTLPETQRVVINLHRFKGLTFKEIGVFLGTTEGAIKLRAFRAYNRVRQQLAPIKEGTLSS